MLTPEESIKSQNAIGSDIMMQLDDVVHSCTPSKARVEEATHRTTRWLDRCVEQYRRYNKEFNKDGGPAKVGPYVKNSQNLYAIIQGGLHNDLREASLKQLTDPRKYRD